MPNELRGACAERITYQIAQLAMTFMDYEDREAGASESDASSEPNGSIANQPVSRDLQIVNLAGARAAVGLSLIPTRVGRPKCVPAAKLSSNLSNHLEMLELEVEHGVVWFGDSINQIANSG